MAKPKENNGTIVLISAPALKSLLAESDKYKEKIDGLTGELREAIGNAVEKKHLDKDAFALVKKFRRVKSLERKKALYDTFLAYMDMSGEIKLIESVEDLPLGGEEDEETDGKPSGKVTQLRPAAE